MLIEKLKHKLMPYLQNCLNSEIELFTSISALIKDCLFIYKQIQATNKIRNRIKLLQSIQTLTSTYLNTKIYQMLIINNCANTFFSCFFSFIIEIILPTP